MLIAFNGTGNKNEDDDDFDTNVTKIVEAYEGQVFYQDGVGTGGWLDKFLGGIGGFGGKGRVKKAIKHIGKLNTSSQHETNHRTVIDVVGFSRGSALAIDFCNEIGKLGYKVRCLMLFDTVASFGLAGNDINIGYDLCTPENCDHIFHAMALDERRSLFPLTRLEGATEVWFRGFHSDIGGGNGNIGLSNIALNWMFARTVESGLSFKGEYRAQTNPEAKCCMPNDYHPNELREVKASDKVHYTVSFRAFAGQDFPANNPIQIGAQTFKG